MHRLPSFLALLWLGACSPATIPLQVELPPTVSTNARYETLTVMPHYVDGQRRGVTIRRAGPESVAAGLQLNRGDIILAFDGVPCDGVHQCRAGARRVEAALRRRRPFSLLVQRGGQTYHYTYRHLAVRRLGM